MTITMLQKSIQIADDLDEQANRLNIYISDPDQKKKDRLAAAENQNALRHEAAKIRIDALTEIIGDQAPTIDEIVSAVDRARVAANKIGQVKKGLALADATVKLFTTLSTGNILNIISSFKDFEKFIKDFS